MPSSSVRRSASGCPPRCGRPPKWPASSADSSRSTSSPPPAARPSRCVSRSRSKTWRRSGELSGPAAEGPGAAAAGARSCRRGPHLDLAEHRAAGARAGSRGQEHHRLRQFAKARRAAVQPAQRAGRGRCARAAGRRGVGPAAPYPPLVPLPGAGRGSGRHRRYPIASRRHVHRGGPPAPREHEPRAALRGGGGAQVRAAAVRRRDEQPRARHRHGGGRSGRAGRVAAERGERAAAGGTRGPSGRCRQHRSGPAQAPR